MMAASSLNFSMTLSPSDEAVRNGHSMHTYSNYEIDISDWLKNGKRFTVLGNKDVFWPDFYMAAFFATEEVGNRVQDFLQIDPLVLHEKDLDETFLEMYERITTIPPIKPKSVKSWWQLW